MYKMNSTQIKIKGLSNYSTVEVEVEVVGNSIDLQLRETDGPKQSRTHKSVNITN